MKTIEVALKVAPYQIHIDRWDLEAAAQIIHKHLKGNRLFVITNTTIARLYRNKLHQSLGQHFSLEWIVVPDGEQHKTLKTCENIYSKLIQKKAHRDSTLLALGGGVVGDITGFVAATYMRGIDFIQIPTTLLAQVDASIGGKTGVDLPSGKNLVGAFYQPKAVIILTDFLKTLPERDYLSGLAEVVKYGLIADDLLFCTLKNNTGALLNRQHSILTKIINTCCGLKAGIVARDEKDHGLRATLNFGHSLGHAIESLQNYRRTRHGEAIAMGMVFASKLSYALRVSPSDHTSTIALLLTQLHLPTQWPSFSHKDYQRALLIDKKTRDRNIRFILLEKIGRVKSVTLDIKSLLPCL